MTKKWKYTRANITRQIRVAKYNLDYLKGTPEHRAKMRNAETGKYYKACATIGTPGYSEACKRMKRINKLQSLCVDGNKNLIKQRDRIEKEEKNLTRNNTLLKELFPDNPTVSKKILPKKIESSKISDLEEELTDYQLLTLADAILND